MYLKAHEDRFRNTNRLHQALDSRTMTRVYASIPVEAAGESVPCPSTLGSLRSAGPWLRGSPLS